MRAKARQLLDQEGVTTWHPLDGVPAPDDYLPPVWTPEHVEKRLVEALETAMATGERVGPGRLKAQGLAYVYEAEDILGWNHEGDDSWRERLLQQWESRRTRPTAAELTRMDQAMGWPLTYLRGQEGPARMLRLWLICRVTGRPVARALARRKIPASTLKRQRRRALELVAAGLRRDGVVVS